MYVSTLQKRILPQFLFTSTNFYKFLSQDTFTWEAIRRKILSLIWKMYQNGMGLCLKKENKFNKLVLPLD